MAKLFLTDKIAKKLNQLTDNGETTILESIVLALTPIEYGDLTNSKKVINTENIFVTRVGKKYRLFYTIEKNEDKQEVILLLDIVNEDIYINKNYHDLKDELVDY